MKKIFLLLLSVGVLVSCSKNDPTEEQSEGKNCKILSFTRLSDELNEGTYDEFISTFYYDSQNRFSKIENKYKNRIEFGRFTYEGNTIKYSEDDLDVIYTLNSKGQIVNSRTKSRYNTAETQVNYTYNSLNQLISTSSGDSKNHSEKEFIYENGNLIKINSKFSISYGPEPWTNTWTTTFTFTNYKAPLYNSTYLELFGSTDGSENLLYSQGYFGTTSKNMVASAKTVYNSDDISTSYFESRADNNGNIIEVIPNSSDIFKYNYLCD